jgi:hypothetical protein
VLADALIAHAAAYQVAQTLTTPEGIHYTIEGRLSPPDGRNPMIRSVWAIETNSNTLRFITAYPLRLKKEEEK